MESVLIIYKNPGETPLEAVGRLREGNPHYAEVKLGYAGRLDPMAEGLLLVLVGEENKKRKEYEKLSKEYEFSFIPGITTDSYDLMGVITGYKTPPSAQVVVEKVKKLIPDFIGKFSQPYPPYSSGMANGKPLYYWSRKNLLHTIKIPEKEVEIINMTYKTYRTIKLNELVDDAIKRIEKVKGDFRQAEIIKGWRVFLQDHKNEEFSLINLSVKATSGTYVRSIVDQIGKKIGNGAVTYSIKRTSVGDYKIL